MEKIVSLLLDIQDKDIRVFNLQKQIASVPAEKEKVKQIVTASEEESTKAKDAILKVENKVKTVEIEINSLKEKIRNLHSKSAEIKKNEEYKALLKEVSQYEKKISAQEDIQIQYWEELEEARKNRAKADKAMASAKNRMESAIDDLDVRYQNCDSQIDKVMRVRNQMAEEIPADILAKYNRLLSKPGKSKSFRKCLVGIQDEICGGCNLKVTPQVKALVKKNPIVPCENCGALLYHGD